MLRGVRRFCSIYWTSTTTEISTRKSLSGLDNYVDNDDDLKKNAISWLYNDHSTIMEITMRKSLSGLANDDNYDDFSNHAIRPRYGIVFIN